MDIHNSCLVVTITSLTLSVWVIWSSLVGQRVSRDNRQEKNIRVILRDLHVSTNQHSSSPKDESILLFVSTNELWPGLHRNLENYFTKGYFINSNKYHQEYTQSYLSILPFFHDADGRFEQCLHDTAYKHNHAVSPRMTQWNRLKWDKSSEGVFKFKYKFKVHYGEASFGFCDLSGRGNTEPFVTNINNQRSVLKEITEDQGVDTPIDDQFKCSHFLIMQDPISLVISDLVECVFKPADKPLCQKIHQRKTTVENWVRERGSVVFKNILLQSSVCKDQNPTNRQTYKQSNASYVALSQLCDNSVSKFDSSIHADSTNRLVKLLIDNIKNLFSLVGIFEDFANSLSMLHQVFRLPLHQCEHVSRYGNNYSNVKPKQKSGKSIINFNINLSKDSVHTNIDTSSSYPHLETRDTNSILEAYSFIDNKLIWDKKFKNKLSSTSDKNQQKPFQSSEDETVLTAKTNTFSKINSNVIGDNSHRVITIDSDNNKLISKDLNKYPSRLKLGDVFIDKFSLNNDTRQDNFDKDNIAQKDVMNDMVDDKSLLLKDTLSLDIAMLRLYKKFAKNVAIRQSLEADILIYEAVKKLYLIQKQFYFKSVEKPG